MEAGIKEQKGVFTMRRPLVRSPIGLELQEQFSLFAATVVRWAAQWAREQAVRQATRGLHEAWGRPRPWCGWSGRRVRAWCRRRKGGP